MSEQVADRFIEALRQLEERQELELLLDTFAARCEIRNVVVSEKFQGRDGARRFWTTYRATFGEMRSTFRSRIVANSHIALEWSTEGTTNGGVFVHYDGVSVLEVEADKIVRFRAYFDAGSLSRQIEGKEQAPPPMVEETDYVTD